MELLAATEAELQAHIASKRRVAVRERVREAERAAAAPEIDLGDIRPEPAMPPRGGNDQLSDAEVAMALDYMLAVAGGQP